MTFADETFSVQLTPALFSPAEVGSDSRREQTAPESVREPTEIISSVLRSARTNRTEEEKTNQSPIKKSFRAKKKTNYRLLKRPECQ